MKNKICKLREELHKAVDKKNKEEIIAISKVLDKLVIEYYEDEEARKVGDK